MDPITENPSQSAPMNQAPMDPNHKKVGPIIATLVIVLVLIIAALYLFASKVSQRAATDQMTDTPSTTNQTGQTQTVKPVTNSSDDLKSIQMDLNASTNGVDNQSF
jgi:hypothetical protein